MRAKDSLKLQNMESSDVMFSCGIEGCERTFSRKDNLKQHIKRSHGGDHVSGRFVCCVGDCKVAFYHRSGLIAHLKTSHGLEIGMLSQQKS